ncbi:MAG: helicase-related protein [Vicinamibacterales bacterium]
MEFLRSKVGDVVRVRQHTWTIGAIDNFEQCRVLSLQRPGPHSGRCHVIEPFDDVKRASTGGGPRRVNLREWRRVCRALIAEDGGASSLRTAATARVDLLPFQLEPALAVLQGLGARVLLADDVGLGKTVQAMLACAELMARGFASRVLVLCPAGLRAQWVDECASRFGIQLAVFDQRSISQARAELPVGINPWTTRATVVSSIDLVKRPEVLPLVSSAVWDVVIVDEAHGASGDSDRRNAVQHLTARTPYVFLLTATPHNGDDAAFSTLCRMGQHGDQLVVFRRSRTEVGGDKGRRVHTVLVAPSDAERRMHAALDTLTRAIRREWSDMDPHVWLMLTLFHKRALSCPYALAASVERRLAVLDEPPAARGEQLWLPLNDASGERDESDAALMWSAPALHDAGKERMLLERLLVAARAAQRESRKLHRLSRLLSRLREPAIVFTEYRDTLLHLHVHVAPHAAIVHGGMTADERQAALASFASGGVLLATDAAGEGLNLQKACRTVVSLELPWNPMRLEQRIGRVDRIGQHKRVHVFHLVSADTGETRLLERLSTRVSRAQATVGAPDPMCGRPAWTEDASARLVVLNETTEDPPLAPHASTAVPLTRLTNDATTEAERVRRLRSLHARTSGVGRHTRHEPRRQTRSPLVASARNPATRASLSGRTLAVFQTVITDAVGHRIAARTSAALWRRGSRPVSARWPLSDDELEQLQNRLGDGATLDWVAAARAGHARMTQVYVRRLRAIADALVRGESGEQPSLFDRRNEHERAERHREGGAAHRFAEERVRRAEATLALTVETAVLRLVMFSGRQESVR